MLCYFSSSSSLFQRFLFVCLFTCYVSFSSPFVCLLLLRRLDQVDDFNFKKNRGVYQDVILLLDSLPSFAFPCFSELIRVSVFVCWFACLLLVSFLSVSTPRFSCLLFLLLSFFLFLSIESLNQFHFNHTYNSTFTVQAITFSYFLHVSAIFPSSLLRLYASYKCECVAFFDSLLCSTLRICVCVIHQARFLSDMATKSVGFVVRCFRSQFGQTTFLEAIFIEGLLFSFFFLDLLEEAKISASNHIR